MIVASSARAVPLSSRRVVGLGFGGWVAAEMATMCQTHFERMVLVGAMGVQPPEGEIVDQFLLDGEEYARLGIRDQVTFDMNSTASAPEFIGSTRWYPVISWTSLYNGPSWSVRKAREVSVTRSGTRRDR